MSCCEGKPISKLPSYIAPYLGSEEFAFVQDGETRAGTLSSFVSYLSGELGTSASLRALSGKWQDTYNIVVTDGGAERWDSNYSTTYNLSSLWQSAYTTVYTLSDQWEVDDNVRSELQAASGAWDNTTTIVQLNSAQWDELFDSSLLESSSASWNSVYSTVNDLSSVWSNGAGLIGIFNTLTGNWDSAYTTVRSNSADWDEAYTTVNSGSCAWDDAYVIIACTDETSDIYTGVVNTLRMPYELDLLDVRASVSDAPIGGDIEIDIRNGGNQSIFTNNLFIDAGVKSSVNSTSHTLNPSFINISDDEELRIQVLSTGTSTAGAGLKISLIGNRKGCL
jgi:hypothetical protein